MKKIKYVITGLEFEPNTLGLSAPRGRFLGAHTLRVRAAVDVLGGGFGFHGDQVEGAMPNAPLGSEFFRKGPHVFGMATQEYGFQTIVMIEMDVH